QPKMQPPIVLRRKPAATGNVLYLLLPVPIKSDLSTNRTPVAPGPFKREFDPLILGVHGVLVNQQGTTLVGHDYVEYPAIPQISQRNRAPVIDIGRADSLGYIHKFRCPIIDPDFLLLISRQAASIEG